MEEIIDSTPPEKISTHIWLQRVLSGDKEKKDSRWKLHIIVDGNTSIDEMRIAWNKVDRAREGIKLEQGTDPRLYSVIFMLELEKQRKVSSLAQLAMDANFESLVYLLWSIDETHGEKIAEVGRTAFCNHLRSLGIKEQAIQVRGDDGWLALLEGNLPWKLKDGPISARRVTDALRQFKLVKKSKKVVIIKEHKSAQSLNSTRGLAFFLGHWTQAKNLFERFDPEGCKSYGERLNALTSESFSESYEQRLERLRESYPEVLARFSA
jgi:hypothetical protein